MAPPAGGGLAKGAGACRRDPHRKPRPDGHGYYAACKHGGPRMMARLSAHRDRERD